MCIYLIIDVHETNIQRIKNTSTYYMVGISLINICQRKKKNILYKKKTLLLITSSLKSVKRLFTLNFTMAIDELVRNRWETQLWSVHSFSREVLPVSLESFKSPSSQFTLVTEPIIVESLERKKKTPKTTDQKREKESKEKDFHSWSCTCADTAHSSITPSLVSTYFIQ